MTKDETREHILKIAAEVFAQKGFANASMNDIVQATAISKGGIYWHFKSKDEIIQAIFVQFFEMQISFLRMMLNQEGSARVRLLGLADSLGRMLAESKNESQRFPHPLDFYSQSLRQPTLLEFMKPYLDNYLKIMAELIQKGIDEQEFVPCHAEDAALVLLSSLDGLVLASSLFGFGDNLAQNLNFAMRLFVSGLEKGSSR